MIANGNERQLPEPKVQDRERRCPNCGATPRLRHKLLAACLSADAVNLSGMIPATMIDLR